MNTKRIAMTVKQFLMDLAKRYAAHDVGTAGSSLAYSLLFAFFPFALVVGWLMGLLHISDTVLFTDLGALLPDEIIGILKEQVETNIAGRTWLLTGGSIMVLYSMIKNSNTLIKRIETAMGSRDRRTPFQRLIVALCFALLLMLATFLSLAMIVVGRSVLNFFVSWFDLPRFWIELWHYGRFAALGVVMLLLLCVLYGLCAGEKGNRKPVFPGAVLAMAGLLVISLGFSFYVGRMGKYTVIYGSIGAVIVLLLWLFLSSTMLLLGGEVNGILGEYRAKKRMATEAFLENGKNGKERV